MPRRFIPSTNMLLAFEAVERLGSVTKAANELAITQGAVSRQIKTLEDQLGVVLFKREKKRIYPTLAGQGYAQEVRLALNQIATASLKLKANPQGGALNLTILPAFGTHWLAPRLPNFLQLNSGVTVNLHTALAQFDFKDRGVDAAIHFGKPNWPAAEHQLIFTEEVVAVCAPSLLTTHQIQSPQDVLKMPLLHLHTRPSAWEHWLHYYQINHEPLTGMLFDQFAMMVQAASHGLGAALLPKYLIEKELHDGRLCALIDGPNPSLGSYYLVWPQDKADYGPLVQFRNWLANL